MLGVAILVLGILIIDQNLRLITAYETIMDLEKKVSQLTEDGGILAYGVLENLKKENREYHPTSVINKSASSGMDIKIGRHNG